ncbi:hypothetical protein C8R45DRAFT_934442 [Mycena sanguinolenta]|nr:hypothetical protein C8R45DRAFT_934442 [Mycena sanguinolenta]
MHGNRNRNKQAEVVKRKAVKGSGASRQGVGLASTAATRAVSAPQRTKAERSKESSRTHPLALDLPINEPRRQRRHDLLRLRVALGLAVLLAVLLVYALAASYAAAAAMSSRPYLERRREGEAGSGREEATNLLRGLRLVGVVAEPTHIRYSSKVMVESEFKPSENPSYVNRAVKRQIEGFDGRSWDSHWDSSDNLTIPSHPRHTGGKNQRMQRLHAKNACASQAVKRTKSTARGLLKTVFEGEANHLSQGNRSLYSRFGFGEMATLRSDSLQLFAEHRAGDIPQSAENDHCNKMPNRELAQSHLVALRACLAPQPFPHLVALRWFKYDIICAPYAHP